LVLAGFVALLEVQAQLPQQRYEFRHVNFDRCSDIGKLVQKPNRS
jgi:hypothetical protein